MRAKFAATNAREFKGPVSTMLDLGLISRENLTHEKAKQYLAEHPELEPAILSTNKRYTFFDVVAISDPENGPDGTIGRPLTAGHSIAVDPQYIPLGAVAYMEAPLPATDADGSLLGLCPQARFVMCQDTGGAIKTPGRADFYAGTGDTAKALAVNLLEPGKLYLLILKFPPVQ